MSDDPRDALLSVAREIVAKRGYVGLSMRTASAAAGVTEDVALRYYRNRESLFAAAMRLPVDPVSAIPALMAPGIEGMGERLVRFTLDTLRDPAAREDLISLARNGVSAGHAVTGLQEFIEIGVVDRVAGMIGVPDARMRSALITSYLLGVATMRYGVRLEPLASASDEEVIRMVAPVIQDLIDPRHPIPGSSRARARTGTAPRGADRASAPQPTRKFDPDPAATRAAEASRLAANIARSAAATPSQPGRTSPTTPERATSKPAAKKPAAKKAASSKPAAKRTTSRPVASKPATSTPATKSTTKPATKSATKKPATKKPATKKPAPKVATAGPATRKITPKTAAALD